MMKFFTSILMVSLSIQSPAQHISELSNEVISSFQKTNPTIKNVEWVYMDSNFIAFFKDKGSCIEKTYNKSGKLLKTKLEIDESFLPKSSSDFVARFYGSKKIDKAYKLFDYLNEPNYHIEIDKYRLSFDSNGSFFKAEIFKKN